MNEQKQGVATAEVSAVELGIVLGLSKQRIGQMANDGILPRAANGRYPLAVSVQAYVRWLKDEARNASKTAAANDLIRQRTRALELKNALLDHRLIELSESLFCQDELYGLLKMKFELAAGAPRS